MVPLISGDEMAALSIKYFHDLYENSYRNLTLSQCLAYTYFYVYIDLIEFFLHTFCIVVLDF